MYIVEHWNYLLGSIMIGLTFWWVSWTMKQKVKEQLKGGSKAIRDDFNKENGGKIDTALELHRIISPNIVVPLKLLREVVLPSMQKDTLEELLEEAVLRKRQVDIDELEKFGLDDYQIAKLKIKYFTEEFEKQKEKLRQYELNNPKQ